MSENEDIEIRNLEANDVFVVANMLRKVTGKAKDEIVNLLKSEDGEFKNREEMTSTEEIELGINIAYELLGVCLEYAENDLKEWFADLLGVTPKEFEKMPFDTPMIVIEQIANHDRAKSFFSKAFALFKKTSNLTNS